MNIYQKLIEVRKLVDFLVKDEQGYQYKYVSGSSVLNTIRPKMDELGLVLTTDVILARNERHTFEGVDNKGNAKTFIQFVVNMRLRMTWIDAEKPEDRIISEWVSSGEDEDPAKAEGKAHTYGERYYLLKFFKIATDNEDPDATQKEKTKVQTIIKPQGVKSMKEFCKELWKEKHGDMDKFNAWLTDQGVENFDKMKEIEYAVLFNKIKAIKK